MRFDVQISEIEKINPLFSKCKIYICYADLNRNNSIIPKNVINDAIPTIYNCPIIGEFNETLQDFMDHGGKIEITNGEVKYIQTTKAYGVIPESSEVQWEDVNGVEYLTATGFLWTSRYPEVLTVLENEKPQSMEIDEVEGSFDDNKKFNIDSFVFSGFCILGSDVEPCFEDAKITAYTLDATTFKSEFALMLQELKNISKGVDSTETIEEKVEEIILPTDKFTLEGGTNLKNLLTKYNLTEEQLVEKGIDISTFTVETLEPKLIEMFKLTHEQLEEEIRSELREMTFVDTDWWGEPMVCRKYYLNDYDEQYAYVVDCQDNYKDFKLPYSMNGDNVEIDYSNPVRIKYTPTDWEGVDEDDSMSPMGEFSKNLKESTVEKFKSIEATVQTKDSELEAKEKALFTIKEEKTNLEKTLNDMTSAMSTFQAEVEKLSQFKVNKELEEKQAQVEAVFALFTDKLTAEEVSPLRENALEIDAKELEDKLYSLLGRKNAKFSLSNPTPSPTHVFMGLGGTETNNVPTEEKTVWEIQKENLNIK